MNVENDEKKGFCGKEQKKSVDLNRVFNRF